MSETVPAPPSTDYVERVNLAIDHVVRHLDQKLVLEDVARVAHFSPFHFHRVFRSLVGETLAKFVQRLRLERALVLMSREPKRTLTDIALRSGFASSSDFSRSFRQRYGAPPSAFDLEGFRRENREALKDIAGSQRHLLERLPPGQNPDGFEVTLRSLPARTMAYIRVLDPYRGGVAEAASRLLDWAGERGVADNPWYGYQWEDPEVTALEDCRYDVAVEVEEGVSPEGEIGRVVFPPMTVAEVEVRGGIDLEQRALDWLFGTWLPGSGELPAHQPCFEAWMGRPFAHGFEHFELYVQLPLSRHAV